MRNLNRWARAAMAAACLCVGLVPSPTALAEPPEPPTPMVPAGSGGPFYFSPPPQCDSEEGGYLATPNVAIPDNNTPITSTVNVGLGGVFVWEIRVTTNITHTRNADLIVTLVSPAGTRVTLTSNNGGSFDNTFAGTLWTDNAGDSAPPGPVTLTSFSNSPESYLAPEEPLSAFMGEAPQGIWTLEVTDTNNTGSQTGRLVSWELDITALSTVPTALSAQVSTSESLPIPDNGTPLLYGFDLPVPLDRVDQLDLTTLIQHPKSNDLFIGLVPPDSDVVITLASKEGGPNANVFNGTVWSDKAGALNPPGPVTDNGFISGTVESPLAPQEPLRAAGGTNDDGQWTLVVSDTVSNGQTGTFLGLTAHVTDYACGPLLRVDGYGPQFARMDAPLPLLVPVHNYGLTTTAPVYVTVTLPIDGAFLNTLAPDWDCTNPAIGDLGGTVFCNRATLAAGATSTVTVQLSPPSTPQSLGTVYALASSAGAGETAESDGNDVWAGAHSANNMQWDVYDNQVFTGDFDSDGGAINDGGQDAFDGWGDLRLAVFDTTGNQLLLTEWGSLGGFGLTYAAGHRWHTTTPVITETIQITREIYAPASADWLRYVDTFTNQGSAGRTVWVAWGGDLGSDEGTKFVDSSSNDAVLTATDTWAVTTDEGVPGTFDPPVGHVLRSAADTTYQGPYLFGADPITTTWPTADEDSDLLAHVYKLTLAAGQSASLAYFVYRPVGETDPAPDDCQHYFDCRPVPAAGSQVTLAETQAEARALHPPFCDLSAAERSKIVNWPGAALQCRLFVPVTLR